MKIGIAKTLSHSSPYEWAEKHNALGLKAVVFPISYKESTNKIDQYVNACREFDLEIAEVGVWKNIISPDKKIQQEAFEYCCGQLELADYIKATCCVNISGAKGEVWDGAYRENYSEHTYSEIIATIQKIIDRVSPQNTFYTVEPMPWMHPDCAEDYLQMIKDVGRKQFGAHMDMVNIINTPQKYLFNKEYTDETFRILGGYIKSCHIKDVILRQQLTVILSETIPGDGSFNILNYIKRAEEVRPGMPMIIEHLKSDEEYMRAIKYIKSITDTGK